MNYSLYPLSYMLTQYGNQEIMTMVNVTQARDDLLDLVNSVQNGEKVTITSMGCNSVLMSEEEYDSLMETLHLLSDPYMAADLDRTRRTPISEMEVWECQDKP